MLFVCARSSGGLGRRDGIMASGSIMVDRVPGGTPAVRRDVRPYGNLMVWNWHRQTRGHTGVDRQCHMVCARAGGTAGWTSGGCRAFRRWCQLCSSQRSNGKGSQQGKPATRRCGGGVGKGTMLYTLTGGCDQYSAAIVCGRTIGAHPPAQWGAPGCGDRVSLMEHRSSQ